MDVVIDSNIINDFYVVTVACRETRLTKSSEYLFTKVLSEDTIYLDDSGHILSEWTNTVNREWINAWVSDLIDKNIIQEIPVSNCQDLKVELRRLGFPIEGSKDFWYVKTAKSIKNCNTKKYIITEDLDFHKPDAKEKIHREERFACLRLDCNQIPNYLEENENIIICCVDKYLC